jgi:hypothetical protein
MSYNILNKNVNFQGATQGTVEDLVDTHTTQTINGLKTVTYLTGTNVKVTNDINVFGNVSASINISASAFYGDGSTLSNIGTVSFDGSTANGMLTYKDADEASVESTLTYDGSSKIMTLASPGAPTGVFNLYGVLSGSGNVSGSAFYGDGFNITNVNASTVSLATNSGLSNVAGGLKVNPTGAAELTTADGDDFLLVADDSDAGHLKRITCQRVANLFNAAVTTYGGNNSGRIIVANGSGDIQGNANLTIDASPKLTLNGAMDISGELSGSGIISGTIGHFVTRIEGGSISVGDATGLAGLGLANASGELDVQVSGALKITSDKVGLTGSIAGIGLGYDGGVDSISALKFNPGSLPDVTMTVADDYIIFLDGSATGDPKKEQWADVINNVAHTGLDASGGRLSVDVSDFMTNGSDNRIITATGADAMNAEAYLSFVGTTLELTGTLATRDTGSAPIIMESTVGTSGSLLLMRYKEMAHTCTTSADNEEISNFFTANMIPFALGIRITTAITRGDATSPHIIKIGTQNDDDSFGTFGDNDLEQSGDNLVTSYHPANATGQNTKWFTSNHELKITYNAQPAAGALRLGLYYYEITPPTS